MRKIIGIFTTIVLLAVAPARADWLDNMRNAGPGEIGLNKTTGGALIGAIGGGLLGSQFGKGGGHAAMTAIGVLGGALAGGYIGRRLDESDRSAELRASQRALLAPDRRQIAWRNPQTGHEGGVRPLRTWRNDAGETCRDLERSVVIDHRREQATVTACRGSGGDWEVRS
jgi:surface antigen